MSEAVSRSRSPSITGEEGDHKVKRIKIDNDSSTPQPRSLGIIELDVGITEFISPDIPGFKGILKQRYTDFLVNEIDESGNVVRLVDLGLIDKQERRRQRREEARQDSESVTGTETGIEIGTEIGTEIEDEDEVKTEDKEKDKGGAADTGTVVDATAGQAQSQSNAVEVSENKSDAVVASKQKYVPAITESQNAKLESLLGKETVGKIFELFSTGTKLITEQQFEYKDERASLHQLIREAFNSRLETRTTPENQFIITLATNTTRNHRSKLDKSSMGTPDSYLHFVIYKENKETMEVANLISKFLRIPPKTISYAGTKDRRGVTVQRACVSKISVERLNGLNKTLRGIKLGSFKYDSHHLRLGELRGNEFIITIREVEHINNNDDEEIQTIINKALSSLRDNGFINYFGMQRFGTFSISTHTIGKYILNADWEQVVNLILSPQALVLPESIEARKIWQETKDASKALRLMPKRCVAEHTILRALVKDGKGYINAVSQIPRNLRVMYVHAYQSYVWNIVASERLKRHGFKIIPGDLVVDNKPNAANDNDDNDDNSMPDLLDDDIEFVRARMVTSEEIESGSKTIFDIVLPTPGFDVIYPENDLREVYETVMKNDGIDFLNMRRNIKEFSLSGNYRSVVTKPGNVQWWCKRYELPTDQFVKTDLELINEGLNEDSRISNEIGSGSKLAIVLKLQLGPSQYATMALREVMKLDTSRRGDGLDVRKAN